MSSAIKSKWDQLNRGQKFLVKGLLGVFVGAGVGFAYYSIVGCTSGACPLTASPWTSAGLGAVIGGTWAIG